MLAVTLGMPRPTLQTLGEPQRGSPTHRHLEVNRQESFQGAVVGHAFSYMEGEHMAIVKSTISYRT